MAGSPRKLIVVDDDPLDVRFVMRAFSDAGSPIEITHVADAEMASDRLAKEAFDYILLDINMPGTDGFGLVEQLRAQGATGRMALFSANVQEPVRQRAAQMGLAFIAKPVTPVSVEAMLAAVGLEAA